MKTRINAALASLAVAASLAAPFAIAMTPATAMAQESLNPSTVYHVQSGTHYEGEDVVVGDDWGQPVYAQWHKGDSGRWWATFWTYNYTKVYASPAEAGCGWVFYCYDAQGNFVQIVRCEESSVHGQVGPQGVSSHWQLLGGETWF